MSDDAVKIPPAVSGVGGWLDDRFHGAKGVRVLMRKVFPDHWSFMLGWKNRVRNVPVSSRMMNE